MSRRGFIVLLGGLLAGAALSLSPASPLPWAWLARLPGRRRWLADALRASLANLLSGAAPPAQSGDADPLGAAEALVAGLSRREVGTLLADADALREFLDRLREADFALGRTRYVEGWLLAESEYHVVTLLCGGARS
jgi:hypothetical protein